MAKESDPPGLGSVSGTKKQDAERRQVASFENDLHSFCLSARSGRRVAQTSLSSLQLRGKVLSLGSSACLKIKQKEKEERKADLLSWS